MIKNTFLTIHVIHSIIIDLLKALVNNELTKKELMDKAEFEKKIRRSSLDSIDLVCISEFADQRIIIPR
jgi:hypothetical protein